jgi:excisionase family DNA binding protein
MPQYNMKIRDACQIFNLSYSTIWSMCKEGKLAHARIGRSYRLSMDDLQQLVMPKAV